MGIYYAFMSFFVHLKNFYHEQLWNITTLNESDWKGVRSSQYARFKFTFHSICCTIYANIEHTFVFKMYLCSNMWRQLIHKQTTHVLRHLLLAKVHSHPVQRPLWLRPCDTFILLFNFTNVPFYIIF
jgi:hypothetical protein